MAVMDFREGGYVFARHKVRREFSYDQNGEPEAQFAANPDGTERLSVRLARLTHYVGALASVALVVGLLVWGWKLVARDVTALPVIEAVQGAARTAPEEPGGELTNYTGYEVNKVAEGAEPAPIDKVAIAPEVVGLTAEDVAMGEFGAEARAPTHESEVPLSFDGEPVTPMSDRELQERSEAEAAAAAAEAAVARASIVDAPATEGPVNEVITDENGTPAQAAAINAALAEAQSGAQEGNIVASARPARRPRTVNAAASAVPATNDRPVDTSTQTVAAAPPERPAPQATNEVVAAEPVKLASVGGPVVQIGAFDSNAVAESEWNRLSGKFGSLFSGKGQVIQKHESNGRIYWRLRVAGFDSKSDAQNFCSAMKAGGADCLALATQ